MICSVGVEGGEEKIGEESGEDIERRGM